VYWMSAHVTAIFSVAGELKLTSPLTLTNPKAGGVGSLTLTSESRDTAMDAGDVIQFVLPTGWSFTTGTSNENTVCTVATITIGGADSDAAGQTIETPGAAQTPSVTDNGAWSLELNIDGGATATTTLKVSCTNTKNPSHYVAEGTTMDVKTYTEPSPGSLALKELGSVKFPEITAGNVRVDAAVSWAYCASCDCGKEGFDSCGSVGV